MNEGVEEEVKEEREGGEGGCLGKGEWERVGEGWDVHKRIKDR